MTSRSTRPWTRSRHESRSTFGDEQGGVDPVEVLVRDDDRGQPLEAEIGARGQPGRELRLGQGAGRRDPLAVEQDATDRPRPRARRRRARRRGPGGRAATSRGRPRSRRRAAAGRAARDEAQQPVEGGGPDEVLAEPGEDGQRRLGARIPEPRRDPDHDEPAEDRHGKARTGPGDDAEPGPDRERDRQDEDLEGELVGRPEDRDHELLRAGRLEVDDDAPDREDRRGDAGDEAGQELAGRDGRPGRGEAGEGRGAARGTDGRRRAGDHDGRHGTATGTGVAGTGVGLLGSVMRPPYGAAMTRS